MRFFLIMAMASAMNFGLNAAELAGKWQGSMETQMGKTDVTITITPGSALAGRVDFGQFDGPIDKGMLDGDKISFEVNIQHGKIGFAGTVAGGEMKLNVTGTQGDQYLLTCQRLK